MEPSQSRLKLLIYAAKAFELTCRYVIKPPSSHEVWLTFDDGPHPCYTPQILDTLKKRGMRATFFMIGERMASHADIVRRVVDEGHAVGNHSYTHRWLNKLSRDVVRSEVLRTDVLLRHLYRGPRVFRPPHGAHNDVVSEVAAECGYQMILWNASTRDWNKRYQPERWTRTGVSLVRMRSSSTVLMHDDLPYTATHLDQFLDRLEALHTIRFMPPDTLAFSGHGAARYGIEIDYGHRDDKPPPDVFDVARQTSSLIG